MNDMSLSRLYRRLLSTREQPVVDAHELASAMGADGLASERRAALAADLAASPQHADLARMLRALEPASAALAEHVGRTRHLAHTQRTRHTRSAAAARRGRTHRLRWAGGVAACLMVTLGLTLWHLESVRHAHHHTATLTPKVHATPLSDRIFTSEDVIFAASDAARHGHPRTRGDELFRGSFAAGG